MTSHKWNSGPPPHVGWWHASQGRYEDKWRWWDGKRWSTCVTQYAAAPALTAAAAAARRSGSGRAIEWTDYWPENARVPRLDPTGGHWTFHDGNGRPPLANGVLVEYVMHEYPVPTINSDRVGCLYWGHLGTAYDIVAWRRAP